MTMLILWRTEHSDVHCCFMISLLLILCSDAVFTVTVLTSVLPKTTCPASPSFSVIVTWVSPEASSDHVRRSTLGICPWGRKKRNQEGGRRRGAGRQAHPSLHDPKRSFSIILNWAKMTRPFHSCMFSLWMHHIGKGLNSGAKLSGTQAASEGAESCCCLLATHAAAKVPSPSVKKGLDGKLQCQLYVSGVTQQWLFTLL